VGLTVEAASSMKVSLTKLELIRGFLPSKSVVQLVGDSNTGKTAIGIDIAVRLSLGWTWAGARTAKAACLYLALENPESVNRRVEAWTKKHGVQRTSVSDLHIATGFIDLRTDSDVDEVIARAKAVGAELVIIDTQSLAIGDAEENSAKDMNLVLANAGRIRTQAGCTVLLIHHVTKAKSSGTARTLEGRGSNAQKGAVDVVLGVDGQRLAIVKNRDGSKDYEWTYRLSPIVIGQDGYGDDVEAIVADVLQTKVAIGRSVAGTNTSASTPRLAGHVATALSILEAVEEEGRSSLPENEFRQLFYLGLGQRSAEAKEQAFRRARQQLEDDGLAAPDATGNWTTAKAAELGTGANPSGTLNSALPRLTH
jgi:hypothetical protein